MYVPDSFASGTVNSARPSLPVAPSSRIASPSRMETIAPGTGLPVARSLAKQRSLPSCPSLVTSASRDTRRTVLGPPLARAALDEVDALLQGAHREALDERPFRVPLGHDLRLVEEPLPLALQACRVLGPREGFDGAAVAALARDPLRVEAVDEEPDVLLGHEAVQFHLRRLAGSEDLLARVEREVGIAGLRDELRDLALALLDGHPRRARRVLARGDVEAVVARREAAEDVVPVLVRLHALDEGSLVVGRALQDDGHERAGQGPPVLLHRDPPAEATDGDLLAHAEREERAAERGGEKGSEDLLHRASPFRRPTRASIPATAAMPTAA